MKLLFYVQLQVVIGGFAHLSSGLIFHLPANQKKCLKEEIHKDVLVTGEYELTEAPGQTANLRVSMKLKCEVSQHRVVYLPVRNIFLPGLVKTKQKCILPGKNWQKAFLGFS